MKKTIYISDAYEVKSGYGKNGKWTLYNVLDQEGNKYGTFESKYISMKGTEVEVEVEEKESPNINQRTGKPYINLNIVEPKKKFGSQEVWDAIQDLRDRVGVLEIEIKALQKRRDDKINVEGEDVQDNPF